MRFVPVLLIALVIPPLSDALKCHHDSYDGIRQETCNAGIEYCLKYFMKNGTEKDCDNQRTCSMVGCETKTVGGNKCCCQGDLCNDDSLGPSAVDTAAKHAATPTFLLPLAAAIFAARH